MKFQTPRGYFEHFTGSLKVGQELLQSTISLVLLSELLVVVIRFIGEIRLFTDNVTLSQ